MRYRHLVAEEAGAYLAHDVLGSAAAGMRAAGRPDRRPSAEDIFGWPDNLKVRSSMTLFARATDDNADFVAVLDKFYDGEEDPATLRGCPDDQPRSR